MAIKALESARASSEKYALREKLFGTTDVIPMWVADMDISTCKDVQEALHVRVNNGYFGYEMMQDDVYEAQIEWMKRRHGLELKREWMLYSPSVVASMSLCIEALSKECDEVIVFTPVYPPFFHTVTRLNRRVSKVALLQNSEGRYEIDFEALHLKAKSAKMILLCSPHNPVGRVWRKDELEKISKIALENNLTVVSDEVHCDLIHPGFKHIPFASLNERARENTVTLLGVGKTFNLSGLGISTLSIASNALYEKVKEVYERVHFGEPSVLSTTAFKSSYECCETWLQETLNLIYKNYELLKNMLHNHAHLIKLTPAEGTYLAWLDCKGMNLSDKKLRSFFVEEASLGLSAGISFSKEGSGFMRLNYAVPHELMAEAVHRLDNALEKYKKE